MPCFCSGSRVFQVKRAQTAGLWKFLQSGDVGSCRSGSALTKIRRQEISRKRQQNVFCASSSADNSSSSSLDLEMPEIEGDIQFYQEDLGAVFDENGVAVSFGNSQDVHEALREGFVILDQSHWGRFKVSGEGAMTFLHGQSTADFQSLIPGEGCETVFVTATARTMDLATCYVTKMGVIVATSPGMSGVILERLEKYLFPGDAVELKDIRSNCVMLSIFGPKSDSVLEEFGVTEVVEGKQHSFMTMKFKDSFVLVAKGSPAGESGYSFIVDETAAGELYAALIGKDGTPIGDEDWEKCRVEIGRPYPGKELTDDVNPMEAGLFHAISLNKGCYIGQETMAKVYRNNAVKQELWCIALSDEVSIGDPIVGPKGNKLGKVTSVVRNLSGEHLALGYLRCKSSDGHVDLEGTRVVVGEISGTVMVPSFATRDFVGGKGAPEVNASDVDGGKSEPEDSTDAEGQQERLKAMQAKLAEYMAQQGKVNE